MRCTATLRRMCCGTAAATHRKWPLTSTARPWPHGRAADRKGWAAWKQEHGKTYATAAEDRRRAATWAANTAFVSSHNARAAAEVGGPRVSLRVNQFGDLTAQQFRQAMLLPARPRDPAVPLPLPPRWQSPAPVAALPVAVDWRGTAVSNVSSQGACGGCYAFAAAGAMEGAWALHGPAKGTERALVPLSVQNILDCSQPEGNIGCTGGDMTASYNYTVRNGGLDTAASYPFTGKTGTCAFKTGAPNVGAKFTSWVQVSGSPDGTGESARRAAGGPVPRPASGRRTPRAVRPRAHAVPNSARR